MVNFEIANYADDLNPFSTKLDGIPVVDDQRVASACSYCTI